MLINFHATPQNFRLIPLCLSINSFKTVKNKQIPQQSHIHKSYQLKIGKYIIISVLILTNTYNQTIIHTQIKQAKSFYNLMNIYLRKFKALTLDVYGTQILKPIFGFLTYTSAKMKNECRNKRNEVTWTRSWSSLTRRSSQSPENGRKSPSNV